MLKIPTNFNKNYKSITWNCVLTSDELLLLLCPWVVAVAPPVTEAALVGSVTAEAAAISSGTGWTGWLLLSSVRRARLALPVTTLPLLLGITPPGIRLILLLGDGGGWIAAVAELVVDVEWMLLLLLLLVWWLWCWRRSGPEGANSWWWLVIDGGGWLVAGNDDGLMMVVGGWGEELEEERRWCLKAPVPPFHSRSRSRESLSWFVDVVWWLRWSRPRSSSRMALSSRAARSARQANTCLFFSKSRTPSCFWKWRKHNLGFNNNVQWAITRYLRYIQMFLKSLNYLWTLKTYSSEFLGKIP